ncbi:MAG: competence protein ComEA [Solirubrobacteraceae bacterium]|jgi:competence protein ComEA|nr:competence protein ComEA [Solirubrobacteraceae bacterium]
MPELTPRQLALGALALLALVGLGAWYSSHSGAAARAPLATAPALKVSGGAGSAAVVVVHVAGAVRDPGVYRLKSGSRVDDAIARAGGARPRADLSALNLAAKLEDGRQVLVPLRPPAGGAAAAPTASGPAGTTTSPGAAPAVPLNLNTATAEQLDALDGIGPATAAHILQYRQEHGGFGSVEELDQVSGIGEKRMETLRRQVRV